MDEKTVTRALQAQATRNKARRDAARTRAAEQQQAEARQRQEDAAEWRTDPEGAMRRAVAASLAGRDSAVRTLRGESAHARGTNDTKEAS